VGSALCLGAGEQGGGHAPGHIFWRVEARQRLAHNLVSLVALDALRTSIPGDDRALRRQHEDRVILDTFDQQPETVLALAQPGEHAFAVGDVGIDLERRLGVVAATAM
jgi:hypothetical protein